MRIAANVFFSGVVDGTMSFKLLAYRPVHSTFVRAEM